MTINFIAEQDESGGFSARAIGASIFTEADTFDDLKISIKEALECHFDPDKMPSQVKLTYGTDISQFDV